MAFEITQKTRSASEDTQIKPNIVLKIDGEDTLFGSVTIQKVIRYGEDDIEYGQEGLVYGGLIAETDQESLISFSGGTSTQIKQSLKLDKGIGESVSSLRISLVDKDRKISQLISPGQVLNEILGKRVKLYFGFADTAWPEDYIIIFRGIIEQVDSNPGLISLDLSHTDQKKRSTVFNKAATDLTSPMGAGDTVADVTSTTDFLLPIVGPDGSTIDGDFRTYLRIDDEIMQYEAKTGTQFQTLTRGALGTTAAAHSSGAGVESFYRLGDSISGATNVQLALKLMLSGKNDFQFDSISVTNFVRISASETVANSIFFKGVDVTKEFNIQVGDFIETTGAANGANNVSPSTTIKVDGVVVADSGSYITVAGVSFVEENDSAALMKIRSQFDVWPSGAGLEMLPDEVDIDEHLKIEGDFLSSFEMDFFLRDEINGKEFLSEQLYNPSSSFSLPRNAQSSMGIHVPPLPTENIVILNIDNVLNPGSLKITRSINKNLFNTFVYKFDESVLEEDRFLGGVVSTNATAVDRIGVGNKTLVIESKGMRESLSATILATAAASRRLRKFAFGAEFIKGVKVHFRDSFNLEIGDKVLVDLTSLKVTDINTGTRTGDSRLFELDNKTLNFRTGEVTLDLVDTNFNKDARFGLIAPSSKIQSVVSGSEFTIKSSFASRFGINEFKKWEKYIGSKVRVVSPDYVTRSGTAVLQGLTGNTVFLETSLGFTPLADDLLLFSKYSDQVLENVKTVFVHLSDDANDFADGQIAYGFF